MTIDPRIRKLADDLAKKLTDEGKLIEAGWVSYDRLVLSPEAPQIQRDECRLAFFAGAQHLFGSMMGILDPGAEPTAKDLDRMSQIDAELRAFIAIFLAKHGLVGK
jgi:hypothetical protein